MSNTGDDNAGRPVRGRLFAPGAARSEEAILRRISHRTAVVEDEAGGERRFEIASVSDRLGRVRRKVSMTDGSVFETEDNDGIDRLAGARGHFFTRLSRLEASWRAVLLLTLATILLVIGAYRYGLPLAANVAARVTPPGVMTLMDQGVLSALDGTLLDASALADTRRDAIQRDFKRLAALSALEDPPLKLLFRRSERIGANAFALPGGTIVVIDALVEEARGEDEIAGVLAHEIAHVEHRHGLRNLYRVLGIGVMIAAIGGDSGQIVEDIVTQAAVIANLSHSRGFEEEADLRGAELMMMAGRDPLAFVDLIGRISGDDGKAGAAKGNWLSTHPGTASRREAVRAHVERLRQR